MLSTHTLSVQVQVPSTTSLWSALNSVITKIPNYKQSVQKQVKNPEQNMNEYHKAFLTQQKILFSLGSVYRNTVPISDILKYRYRCRRRYSEYRKISNTDN